MKSSLDTNKILIYGGAFNPPHLGHRKIIELAVDSFDFKKIMIVPSFQKIFSTSKTNLSFEQRVKLSQLNFQNTHPELFVNDIEKTLNPPVYSFHLITQLLEDMPHTKEKSFVFLMGDDQIPSLSKWHRFTELCKITDFLVANRQEDHLKKLHSKTVESLSQMKLKTSIEGDDIKLTDINCTFHFLDNTPIKISSTEIRNSGYSLQNLHPNVMKALEENHVDH